MTATRAEAGVGPLAGYRVLDLCDERGLLAGRLLADLGADVVLVEPPAGSSARLCPPRAEGGSYFWDTFAASRRGIVADLTTGAGRDVVRQLAARADFVIESAGPGVAAALGVGWADLQELNPALVYASLTAFGHDGPKAGYAESDLVLWAAGGPLEPNRDGTRPPLRISVPQAYLSAAADAVGGLLIAHHWRALTGRGQFVDVSVQAAMGLNTLARVLSDAVRDPNPEWSSLVNPLKRTDQSGSGSGTSSYLKKWECIDGLVEFHLSIGPAAGGFTNNFFRWMAAEGFGSERVAGWDWRIVPQLIESGAFGEPEMSEARAAVGSFLATKTKAQIEQAALDFRLLCVGINTTADLARSRQLDSRAYFATVTDSDSDSDTDGARVRRMPARWASGSLPLRAPRAAPTLGQHTAEVLAQWLALPAAATEAPAPPAAATSLPNALAGLKVADFSWVVAGPTIGRALADFGATVVRVESSHRTDTARIMQPFYDGQRGVENSALYSTSNAGKLGMTLDLRTEQGREVARDLIRWADVVIESYAPGQMARWGLDYTTLSADDPSLVMLSTSLMGQTGPSSTLAGYGNIGASMSGYQDLVGWPDRPPIGPFGPYTDYVGPRFALPLLLATLDRRRRTGQGAFLDVAQSEIGAFLLSPQLADYFDRGTIATRRGNADERFAPHGVFACRPADRNRFVAIAICTDEQWVACADEIGQVELAAKYPTEPDRRAAAGELEEVLAEWTADQQAEDVEARLQRRGVPAHVCATSADFTADPQLRHRGHLRALPHPRFGTCTVEGPRYLLSETAGVVRRPAPSIGQDTEYVLRTLLGYGAERYDRLVTDEVLT